MNVNNPTSVAIDVVVILSSGIIFQLLKLLCRNKAYPLIANSIFKLENDQLIMHFSKQLWKLSWHSFCFILSLCALIQTSFWPSISNPYNGSYGTSLFWENL